MGSGQQTRLSRLLLQRSDRHPARCLVGEDLAGFGPDLVCRFLQLGLIVEREPLSDVEGLVFQPIEAGIAAISVDDDHDAAVIASEALQQFEIDLASIGRQIRAASQLTGAPVEVISSKVLWLGAMGAGSRRREFYLVRTLRARDALDLALAMKGRSVSGKVALVTPTERNLPNAVLKQLAAEDIVVISASDALDSEASEPFRIVLPTVFGAAPEPQPDERLVIDAEGMRATFDGVWLDLRQREFRVLQLMVVELVNTNGIVRRDLIYATIREVTGNEETNEEQVDKSISLLRRAFASAERSMGRERTEVIRTERRVGYSLTLPPEAVRIY